MKNKKKNPLRKRVFRELKGDWRKYLVVSLFLILTIGFVSGMYVANESMSKAIEEGYTKYKLEDGHFELKTKVTDETIAEIESGNKADLKTYYLNKARKELNEKFEAQFIKTFDEKFEAQVKENLLSQGLTEEIAESMLPEAVQEAKTSDSYTSIYNNNYDKAYEDAWQEVKDDVNKSYKEAEKEYELDNSDFNPVPVNIYEQFYKNEKEDNDNDGKSDGTIRIYQYSDDVNEACVLKGRLPETKDEIAIDRMHADNAEIKVGDKINIGNVEYKVVGLIAYTNYATLHEKNTDLMFDALNFDVGMVTVNGFDQLHSTTHYSYAWKYKNSPADKIEEKTASDNFMKALITQSVVADTEIQDYLPTYENQAVQFAPDDIGGDKAMGGVLLYILIVVIGFIFAITIANTITREASQIGTLRASGYTKGELVRHYLSMPILVTLISAVIGNVLGYSVFKNIVVGMYYNSYSLPSYKTIWNGSAFVKTTIIPLFIMIVVNLTIIIRMMQYSPLRFLHHDFKRSKRKKAMRLPSWKFFSRFRLRVMLQNIPNYLILFTGILLVAIMLAMAVGMPDTLKYYKDNASDLMFTQYQYVLKNDEIDGKKVTTKTDGAEQFSMRSVLYKSDSLDEEITVYGISNDSRYVKIYNWDKLKENEVYISQSFQKKYDIQIGDNLALNEKYENKQYELKVAGIYKDCQTIAVFMPGNQFNQLFNLEKSAFNGFLSNIVIDDLDADNVATVITKKDITKVCDQLDHSMGAYMLYFQYLCILLSAVLIYLLTKIIIEKNENSISMTKILGYSNGEIASLYMLSTSIVVTIADAICVIAGSVIMGTAWKAIMYSYSGWFDFVITPIGYAKIFGFIFVGYLIVMCFDFIRIKRIPMEEALKNVE